MRGQAALEYLVTYGWAVGVILVVIGAFSYIGFTQTEQYIPSSCTIGGDFACEDFELASDSANFLLVNTGREQRYVDNVIMIYEQLPYDCNLGPDDAEEESTLLLGAGARAEIRCENVGYNAGDRVSVNIEIEYRVSNDAQAFTRRAQGTIIGQSIDRPSTEPIPVNGICGSNARTYNHDTTSWPGNDFCSQGSLITKDIPEFPAQGSSVDWVCQGAYGGESPTCTATRNSEIIIPGPEPNVCEEEEYIIDACAKANAQCGLIETEECKEVNCGGCKTGHTCNNNMCESDDVEPPTCSEYWFRWWWFC